MILNEPAGKIAQIVVQHTVNLVVEVILSYPLIIMCLNLAKAWFDEGKDIHRTIDTVRLAKSVTFIVKLIVI